MALAASVQFSLHGFHPDRDGDNEAYMKWVAGERDASRHVNENGGHRRGVAAMTLVRQEAQAELRYLMACFPAT